MIVLQYLKNNRLKSLYDQYNKLKKETRELLKSGEVDAYINKLTELEKLKLQLAKA